MKAIYRPATDIEQKRAEQLWRCTLPPASMTKRFANQVRDQVRHRKEITEKQAAFLAVCCYRFRRQLPKELVPESPPPGYHTPSQTRMLLKYNEACTTSS